MKLLVALLGLSASSAVFADATYLGLYLKGDKLGYASYQSYPCKLNGQPVMRSDSRTVMSALLEGSAVSLEVDSTTWSSTSGHPLRMVFDSTSGGRSNKVDASFRSNSVVLNILNGGVKSSRTISVPVGACVVDDPLTLVLAHAFKPGTTQTVLVLDPTTASLLKNQVFVVGRSNIAVGGKSVAATLVRVTDPRSVTDVYIDKKGEVVRVNGPMGIYMLPVSKEVALSQPGVNKSSTDLAVSSSIKAVGNLPTPELLSHLKIKLFSDSITTIPSDQYQTATKLDRGWLLDIHPPQLVENRTATIARAAMDKPQWLAPSLNIPSDSPTFKKLAERIVGAKKDVQSAAFAIQNYVNSNMTPNAGIGVLRDATEVLSSKEGVCRDYATLTVTLLRAAGIPSRLASGLVSWDGTFYYHAWAEAWDGMRWIGVDSTTDRSQISASHVKLGDGNIDTAFAFTFLEKARIEILEARKD